MLLPLRWLADFTKSQAVSMEEESVSQFLPQTKSLNADEAENRGGLIKSLDGDEPENRSDRSKNPSGFYISSEQAVPDSSLFAD